MLVENIKDKYKYVNNRDDGLFTLKTNDAGKVEFVKKKIAKGWFLLNVQKY